jgi:MazG family protein
MISRHPHIFNDETTNVKPNWEELKENERKEKNPVSGVLDGIAITLPALVRAFKLQNRAARVGFDWPTHEGALKKLNEEISELIVEIEAPTRDLKKLKDELGDVLFSVVNLARKLKINPDECLKSGNFKFKTRFEEIEKILKINKKTFDDVSLDILEKLWIKAKEKQMVDIN